MRWAHLDDITLRYELSGAKSATIVLLHELGGNIESFDGLVPELQGRFRVLRYDLRGAGLSEKPRQAFSFADHIEDLAKLSAKLDIEAPIHLVGVAAGAAVAVGLALAYPRLVGSLTLCAPALSVDEERVRYLAQRSELATRDGMRAVVADTLGRSYPPIMRRDEAAYLDYLGRFLANDPVGYAHSNLAFAKVGLVLAGLHDGLRPPDKTHALARMIPGAHYAVIDSGHLMPVQAPGEIARHLLAFLARAADGAALSRAL